jgi:uncharacterized protein (DUF433 family)
MSRSHNRWLSWCETQHEEILADHPYRERKDMMQALCYAAGHAEEREVVLAIM